MNSAQLDIFRKDLRGNIWLDCARDLETARYRMGQLALISPGEYFVFDQRTRQIVASLVRTNSNRFRKEDSRK